MLTPSIRASRTSDPCVIRVQAFSTQVTVPPFLNQLPLAEEMTTGFTPPVDTAGAFCASARGAEAARPAAAEARTKSRRVKRRAMEPPSLVARSLARGWGQVSQR